MKNDFEKALNKLADEWPRLNWNFKNIPGKGLVSQWQGEKDEDIMVVVFRGREINEPFHKQDFFFINFAYQNSYSVLSQQSSNIIKVNEGDYYVGQPFSGYALRAKSRKDIIMIGIHIRQDTFFRELFPFFSYDDAVFNFFVDPKSNAYSDDYVKLSFDEASPARGILENMVIEYADKREDTQSMLKIMATLLIMNAVRNWRANVKEAESESLAVQIKAYINSHSESVTLQEIADHFGYHPNYLSTYIRKEFGSKFSDIILESRMRRAKILLENSTLTIEEISNLLGYTNTSNFYKAFKKYYGCSPRSFQTSN